DSSFSRCFFFSSRRRHTRFSRDWSSDVCSSDLACQLGFERMLVARALHELADAKTRIFRQDRKAAVSFRQPLTRQLQARIVHAIGGYRDRARGRIQLVWNASRIERLRDLGRVLLTEIVVE